jgi:drug/metabolite transporter (DMT)-like permease
VLATLLAVSGIVVLASGSMRIGMETLIGDLVNVLSLFLLAGYLALARRQRQGQSLFGYVVPLYFVGGSLTLVLALIGGADFRPLGNLAAWLPAIGLAVGPTAVGHTIFNRAMGTVPSQTVSLFIVTQFVFAGFYAAIIFRELPFPAFYPAATLVLAGVTLDLRAGRKATRIARDAER